MLNQIKSRTYALNKKMKDIVYELNDKYNINASAADVTNALNDRDQGPKAKMIVEKTKEIVSDWEKSSKGQAV